MQDARPSIDLSAAGRTHRPGRHALLRKRRIPCGLFFSVLRILVAVTSNHGGSSVMLVVTSESGTNAKSGEVRRTAAIGGEADVTRTSLTDAIVKVCGCRPMMVARRAPGPAYANLQGRKPREVWRGRASDAMGISASAVCRRGLLNACVGSDQGDDDPGWPVSIGRTGVASARSNHTMGIAGGARSRLIVAGRDSAKQR
jgi:hypothetical protein